MNGMVGGSSRFICFGNSSNWFPVVATSVCNTTNSELGFPLIDVLSSPSLVN